MRRVLRTRRAQTCRVVRALHYVLLLFYFHSFLVFSRRLCNKLIYIILSSRFLANNGRAGGTNARGAEEKNGLLIFVVLPSPCPAVGLSYILVHIPIVCLPPSVPHSLPSRHPSNRTTPPARVSRAPLVATTTCRHIVAPPELYLFLIIYDRLKLREFRVRVQLCRH